MNRSTGLLRAYVTLIQRVGGASSVCLFVPSKGGRAPILIQEGDPVLPELSSLERACAFSSARGEVEPGTTSPSRLDEPENPSAHGWLIAVPYGLAGAATPRERDEEAPKRRSGDRAIDRAVAGACWLGLGFESEPRDGIESTDLFHLHTSDARGPENIENPGLASLLDLGGVLAWYAGQFSAILDDPVTGLVGRTEFQASLARAFESARRSKTPLSLMFINPDDFTEVNEKNGHEAGDDVLREIAERLRATQRTSDSIAKYGGAIFASFLEDTDLRSARVVAEKIWVKLAEAPYLADAVRVGISLGVAVFDPEAADVDDSLELIRRADKALNSAKRLGGDQVVAWELELESREPGNVDRMTGVYTGNMAKDYRNMTLLSDTMAAVAGSSNPGELAERVVERLHRTLKADHVGIIEWFDDEASVLTGATRTGANDGGTVSSPGLELGRAQMALLEDARREMRSMHASFADDFSEQRILSFAAPLVLNDRCLGCLYVDGRADTLALEDASDLGFLRAFATQLAVALDRARLSEQQQHRSQQERLRLEEEVDSLRLSLKQASLVYCSREMDAVLHTVRRVAPTKATVLVIGESGTGKELVARTIHEMSPVKNKPLVVVDCGAIPTTLIESELFGHERGAYTGAQERRVGRLLEAEGGTVVLDEIGELPLEVQSKLLRFVQERQITPVGGTRTRQVDTRLVAVTNRELAIEAAAGRFREDLYYRLNVVRITVPPLRERPDDILYLANFFLERFARQYQKGVLRFDSKGRALMLGHSWPGNVRELQNRVMQAVILSEGTEIGVRELELERLPPEPTLELDVTTVGRRAASHPPPVAARDDREIESERAGRTPRESCAALGAALARQIAAATEDDASRPVPLGTWLMEDLVLRAYEAADHVSGQARAILGIPETTFRRRLSKAQSKARAELLTRRPPWNQMTPVIEALVRTPGIGAVDVLQRARDLLLTEVTARVKDPSIGAQLMGVTVRTYRRWTSEFDPRHVDPRAFVSA